MDLMILESTPLKHLFTQTILAHNACWKNLDSSERPISKKLSFTTVSLWIQRFIQFWLNKPAGLIKRIKKIKDVLYFGNQFQYRKRDKSLHKICIFFNFSGSMCDYSIVRFGKRSLNLGKSRSF